MTPNKPSSIDEYMSTFPDNTRKALQQVRTIVRKVAPHAEETISYGMPCFKTNGKYLIYFAGYKRHIGIYPVPTNDKDFERKFAKYKTSGKGTLQLPLDQPIPSTLLTAIVRYRMKQNYSK